MADNVYDILIVGGGAAGLFAAASAPARVKGLILDKAKAPGRKLLMSGAGQCNLTHGGSIKDFVSHYGDNGSKIRTALYKFSNESVKEFFENKGIPLIEREDGKIFPRSMDAKDVLDCLIREGQKNGFSILSSCDVTEVIPGDIYTVISSKGIFKAKKLLICTGGCSYPTTGSDGRFLKILEALDLEIIPTRPSLVPVSVEGYPYTELSGVSVKDITIEADGHKVSGDILFTHNNFSGPAVLHISRYVKPGTVIKLCYCTDRKLNEVQEELALLRKDKSSGRKEALTVLNSLFPGLPSSFIRKIFADEGFDEHRVFAEFSSKAAAAFLSRVFADTYKVSGTSGYSTAMATAGGVSLKEISLKTGESKKYPGLYLAGEVLDVDGDTGGYNLQFAFSSGYNAINGALSSFIDTSGIK